MLACSWKMMGTTVAGVLALGAATAVSMSAHADGPPGKPSAADKAIEYRQAVMTVISATVGPLGEVAKGGSPFNAEEVTKRAGRLAVLAPMAAEAFPDISKEGRTRAKPEIWNNRTEFDKDMKAFTDAAGVLDAQVRQEPANSDSFKSALSKVGQSCKSCHDDFRKK